MDMEQAEERIATLEALMSHLLFALARSETMPSGWVKQLIGRAEGELTQKLGRIDRLNEIVSEAEEAVEAHERMGR